MPEAKITINGVQLGVGQSMTIRVALESFASTMQEYGLGDDEHGKEMAPLYFQRIEEIRTLINN